MKKTILSTVVLSALSVSPFNPQASDQAYIGAGVIFAGYEEPGADADIIVANARLGTALSEHVSVEARLGFGLMDDTINVMGVDVDVQMNYMIGAYGRFGFNATDDIYPYALVGYTRGQIEASAGGFTAKSSESDVSFGAGDDFKVNERVKVSAEYVSYLDKDGAEVSGPSISALIKF